jgi:hypothetical protein
MELEAARWRERQITTKFQSHMSSRFYSEWRAKFRPFRIKLRTPRLRRRHRPSRVSGSNRKTKITARWSSLQFDPYAAQRYRHADNIIAGRSLTGHAIGL